MDNAGQDSISSTIPDWAREEEVGGGYEPGKKLLSVKRRYETVASRPGPLRAILRPLLVLQHRFWSAVSGAEIPLNAKIAGGLSIPHPNGIVIHPEAEIGPNCLIFQQVTIGTGPRPGTPIIEGHVDIGAGAKILGGVRIGAHARVGANAVVIDDVPPRSTAVGVPAESVGGAEDAGSRRGPLVSR